MVTLASRSRYAIAGLWAGVVLVGSLVPGTGGTLPPTGPLGLVGPDKWLHAAEYGLLAGLVAWATVPRTRGEFARILVVVVGYGAAVELLQIPLATRAGDPTDALANGVGAAAAVALWFALGLSRRVTSAGDGDDGRSRADDRP